MALLSLSIFGDVRKETSELAARIAPRCHAAVWARVERRAPSMRLSEARGYIRARAAAVVHAQVNAELNHTRRDVSRADLMSLATDKVVTLVFRELLAVPPRQKELRRAA